MGGSGTEEESSERATVVEPRRSGDPAEPVELDIGARLDRYVVLERRGAGGMGVVYAAYDPELDRKVAVKLLGSDGRAGSDGQRTSAPRGAGDGRADPPERRGRLRRRHDRRQGVRRDGARRRPPVRRLARTRSKRGATSWRRVHRRPARGLAAAHDAGIVHRDFKPDNVLMSKDGVAKVTDFGLARAEPAWETPTPHAGMLASPLTIPGAVMGTPRFMAPEQWRREAIDARTDQFAFCVSLYLALYGVEPFGTGEQRLDAILANRLRDPPAGAAPTWVHRAIVRGLRAEPAERWPNMRALIAELERDPAIARRRVAVGAVLGVGIAGALAGALMVARQPAQPCADADAYLAGVWDGPRRAAIERAFRTSPDAARVLASTTAELDDYARDWVAMRGEACEATRIRGDQAEDVFALRTDCLDTRLVELRTLVRELGSADAHLVGRAAEAARGLSPLAGCADVASLRAPDHLPADPAARANIIALRADIAEGRGLLQVAHYKDALALAQHAATGATTLGHRPTQAEALVLQGHLESLLSQRDNAERDLLAAVVAGEAGKADVPKLEAWTRLIREAVRAGKLDVALERSRLARAVLERLGSPYRDKAELLRALVDLQSQKGAMDDALATAVELRTLIERAEGTTTLDYANALGMEAAVLTDSGRRADGLALHRKVLAAREALLGPNHPSVAVSLVGLASVEIDLGHYEDGAAHARRAIAIDEVAIGPDSPEVATALNQVASALTGERDYTGALAALRRAETNVVKTLGDDDLDHAFLLANIGILQVELQHPADAIPEVDRAVAIITKRLGPDNQQTGVVLAVQCTVQLAAGHVDAAVATGKRALAIGEATSGRTSPLLFDTLVALATAELATKQPADALALLDRALAAPSGDPIALHAAELTAARAAWDRDRARAVELAHRARDGYAQLGPSWTHELADVDAWLGAHAAR